MPGWYPDPAGQPNRFRYWDGQQWSEVTTDNPYLPPPPPPGAVPPPQQPSDQPAAGEPTAAAPSEPGPEQETSGQPGGQASTPGWGPTQASGRGSGDWTPMTPAPSGSGGGKGRGPLVAVVAIVVVLLLVAGGVVGWYLVRDADRAGDSRESSQSDEPTDEEPTDEPSETADDDEPLSSCPPGNPVAPNEIRNGRVLGGGLSFPVPDGYRPSEQNKLAFEWLHGVSGVERTTESHPRQKSGWVSMLVAGSLEKADGYTSPEQAALSLTGCMASSPRMYRSHVSDRQLSSEALEVDGQDAWVVRHEVRIEDEIVRTEGDHIVVVVVDLGDDEEQYGVVTGFVPLEDEALRQRLDRAVATTELQ